MAADRFDAIIVGGGLKGCEAAAGAVSADRQRGGIPANGACVFGSPRENVRNIFGRLRELVLRRLRAAAHARVIERDKLSPLFAMRAAISKCA